MEAIARRRLGHFWALTVDMLEFLRERTGDPECEDMLLYTRNCVLENTEKMTEGIKAWCDCMLEPLDSSVRYAKPLDRIIDGPGVVFHAMSYRDVAGMTTSTTSDVWARLKMAEKMSSPDWTEADSESIWTFMDELAHVAFSATSTTPPRVPTRDELAQSIRSKKKSSVANESPMTQAFNVAVNALCGSRNVPAVSDAAMGAIRESCQTLLARDSSPSVIERVTSRDESVLPLVNDCLPALGCSSSPAMQDRDWTMLSQLLTMSSVERAVPRTMMANIEQVASKLANDVMEGRCALTPDRLQEVSTEVMSTINPSDLQRLTASMGDLMPALSALSAGMQNDFPPSR